MTTNDATFAGSIPALYDRHLGPVLFEPYAADKVRRLARLSEGAILETASGTGIVTRRLASALPAAVRIVATDLNQPMLDHAASKPGMERVEFRQADALKLPSGDGQFDAVVCQFGVMFFPDRVAAYREARRVLKPNGQLVFSVWDSLMRNPYDSDRHRRHGGPLSARPAAISCACATWLSRCRRDTRRACGRRLHHSRNRDGRADSVVRRRIAIRRSASARDRRCAVRSRRAIPMASRQPPTRRPTHWPRASGPVPSRRRCRRWSSLHQSDGGRSPYPAPDLRSTARPGLARLCVRQSARPMPATPPMTVRRG